MGIKSSMTPDAVGTFDSTEWKLKSHVGLGNFEMGTELSTQLTFCGNRQHH